MQHLCSRRRQLLNLHQHLDSIMWAESESHEHRLARGRSLWNYVGVGDHAWSLDAAAGVNYSS